MVKSLYSIVLARDRGGGYAHIIAGQVRGSCSSLYSIILMSGAFARHSRGEYVHIKAKSEEVNNRGLENNLANHCLPRALGYKDDGKTYLIPHVNILGPMGRCH